MGRLIIERVYNGYLITDESENTTEVVEELESKSEHTIQRLLFVIMDRLGYYGSKHNKERCVVNIRHGESYDCDNDECEICLDASWDCRKCQDSID